MYTYKIKGRVSYPGDQGDGYELISIDINETVEVEEMGAEEAFWTWLDKDEQEECQFFGRLTTCDAKTYGKKGATLIDQNEEQTIDVELQTVD